MSSSQPSNDSCILRMPNEILRLCFEQVAQLDRELARRYDYIEIRCGTMEKRKRSSPHQGQINVEGQYSLVLTCRRFHDLIMPILYTTIRIDAHEFHQEWSLQKDLFFRTIDENPALQIHIKDLKVNYGRQGFNSESIRSLVKLPHLECLALDRVNLDSGEVDLGPSPEEKATANFTTISFWCLHATPEDIRRLVEWPRNLYTFDLDHMTCDDYDWEEMEPDPAYRWDHDRLTDVLMPQRQSLRVLRLGWLGYTLNQNTFSTWKYPQLHTLTLCITYESPTPDACLNWLSPSIQTLILDLHYHSVQQGTYSMFTRSQVRRVLRVGCWASKIKTDPGRGGEKLERIGIRVLDVDSEQAWLDQDRESRHWHDDSQDLLVLALETLEKCGFKSFWVAPSGAEYTAEEVRAIIL